MAGVIDRSAPIAGKQALTGIVGAGLLAMQAMRCVRYPGVPDTPHRLHREQARSHTIDKQCCLRLQPDPAQDHAGDGLHRTLKLDIGQRLVIVDDHHLMVKVSVMLG